MPFLGLVIVTLIPRVFRRRSQLGQGNVMQDPISATTSERRRPGDDKTAQVWMLGATAWMLGATVWMLGATVWMLGAMITKPRSRSHF
eukprot:1190780-Prorocentrum_minimum.AAC.2